MASESQSQSAVRSHPKPRIGAAKSFRLSSPSLNAVRLRRIFDVFDKNGDGVITVQELHQALNLLGLQSDVSDLESMIQAYIHPGNDGLRYEDFESLHRSLDEVFFQQLDEVDPSAITDEDTDLCEAFKVFDEDGDGYISARELQVVLGKLGLKEGREMDCVEKMISSVDRNRDGRVDFVEFKDMMRSVVVPS